jgi:hypothetical protein
VRTAAGEHFVAAMSYLKLIHRKVTISAIGGHSRDRDGLLSKILAAVSILDQLLKETELAIHFIGTLHFIHEVTLNSIDSVVQLET